MMSEDAMYDDGVVMEAVVEKFVKYFKSIFHHNNWYFASYIFCKLKIPLSPIVNNCWIYRRVPKFRSPLCPILCN